MTTRVGLVVLRDAIAAVALRRDTAFWTGETGLDGRPLQEAIASLLAQVPRPRRPWSRALVSAAVGPHAAQVKRVTGLPDIDDPATISAVIREGVGTFFRKNSVPLVVTAARPDGPGAAFAAVIDAPCVEAIRGACLEGRWRLGCIAPAAVTLPRVIDDSTFTWTDGELTLEITHAQTTLSAIRTRPAVPDDAAAAVRQIPSLAEIDLDHARYAPAFGVASLSPSEPLALSMGATGLQTPQQRRRMIVRGWLLLAVGVVCLALSPLAASRASGRAAARLAALSSAQWHTVVSALGELDRVTRVLDDAATFAHTRSSVTPLLGALARQLDDRSVVVSLELSEERGELVLLTPHPASALAALSRLPGVTNAELVGSARAELLRGRELHRVTIRLLWSRGTVP